MNKKELLKGLTPTQIEKVYKCKHQVELLELAKIEGIELSDEQLNAVVGGGCYDNNASTNITCPICGRGGDDIVCKIDVAKYTIICRCKACDYTFEVDQNI